MIKEGKERRKKVGGGAASERNELEEDKEVERKE